MTFRLGSDCSIQLSYGSGIESDGADLDGARL